MRPICQRRFLHKNTAKCNFGILTGTALFFPAVYG